MNRDMFVCLQIGSGKLLCYSLLPTARDIFHDWEKRSIIVAVSSLAALMKDQLIVMSERNVRADDVRDAKLEAGRKEVTSWCSLVMKLFLST